MIEALLLSIDININPTIVEVLGLEITWHGLFTAVGVVVGVAIATWLARREGYPEDMIYNVALALVIGGIIGARGLYVIENLGQFRGNWLDVFAINTGGISIYGALIGGTIGAGGYALWAKVPNIPKGADIAAIGAIMGMAVGRIGDIINGEHFAKSTDLPWGFVYTHPDSPSVFAERVGIVSQPQHPAVAYEMLGDLVIFVALLFVYFRVPRSGVAFFSFVLLYGILRFFVSFLRLDEEIILGLRTAQLIALAAIPIGIGGIIYLLRTPPREEGISRAERRRRLQREESAEEPAG